MDVYFFLEKRLDFIQRYYDTASVPFADTLRKIEAGENPFETSRSERDEPPFFDDWCAAKAGLEVLGRSGISMLSEALKLYFKTWSTHFRLTPLKTHKKAFEGGFVLGYRALFGDALSVKWDECPADFCILEQIVLARNADHHGGNIVSTRAEHTDQDRKKFPMPFFANDKEMSIYRSMDPSAQIWMAPTVEVSAEKLTVAINEVKSLAQWLESRFLLAERSPRAIQVAAYASLLEIVKEKVRAAQDEAAMAATFHETWKPTAYDADLHNRIGKSFAGNSFLVVRTALRRELFITLMRLWDNDWQGRAIGLESIGKTLADDLFFDALIEYRTPRLGVSSEFAEGYLRKALIPHREEVIELIKKYSEGGKSRKVLTDLKRMRNEHLAHRQTTPAEVSGSSSTDSEIEVFYEDNLKIVELLLKLILATSFVLSEVGDVYRHHAKFFWASVRGERTAGHPNFRPSASSSNAQEIGK